MLSIQDGHHVFIYLCISSPLPIMCKEGTRHIIKLLRNPEGKGSDGHDRTRLTPGGQTCVELVATRVHTMLVNLFIW